MNNNNTLVGIVGVPSYSTTYGVPTFFFILFLCLFIHLFPPPVHPPTAMLVGSRRPSWLLTDIRRDGRSTR